MASSSEDIKKDVSVSQHKEDNKAPTLEGKPFSEKNVETEYEQETINKLRNINNQHKNLEKAYTKEWNALKASYERQYKSLYDQRAAILNNNEPNPSTATPALPNFWLKAFLNNRALQTLIETCDGPILSHLQDVRSDWLDEMQQEGFRLTFQFSENPYFTPNVLIKEYHMRMVDGDDDPFISNSSSTMIQWKEGKDVTKKVVQRKQMNKKTNQTRTVSQTMESRSFFNLFTNHETPTEQEFDKMDEQELEDIEMTVVADYNIGVVIRERIIPKALEWYLGEGKDEHFEFDSDSDGEDGDSDEEDDEESEG